MLYLEFSALAYPSVSTLPSWQTPRDSSCETLIGFIKHRQTTVQLLLQEIFGLHIVCTGGDLAAGELGAAGPPTRSDDVVARGGRCRAVPGSRYQVLRRVRGCFRLLLQSSGCAQEATRLRECCCRILPRQTRAQAENFQLACPSLSWRSRLKKVVMLSQHWATASRLRARRLAAGSLNLDAALKKMVQPSALLAAEDNMRGSTGCSRGSSWKRSARKMVLTLPALLSPASRTTWRRNSGLQKRLELDDRG